MHPGTQSRPDHSSDSGTSAVVQRPHRIASTDLFRGERRVIIEHGRESYTLILTRNGKLILTK